MAIKYESSERIKVEEINPNLPATNIKARWFQPCSPQYLLLIVMLVTAILVSLVALVVFTARLHSTTAATTPVADMQNITATVAHDGQSHPSRNSNTTTPITIIHRSRWIAQVPVEKPTPLQMPVPYVIILETSSDPCTNTGACVYRVRYIQRDYIDGRNLNDIPYNFLVGGDGYVYEGRGWQSQGAHTLGYDARSIGIALIGSFNHTRPVERQIAATKRLIDIGLEKGYIDPTYKLLT